MPYWRDPVTDTASLSFRATPQHSPARSGESYREASCIIVTDICQFFFDTDAATVRQWIDDYRQDRQSIPPDSDPDPAAVGWSPAGRWDNFLRGSKNLCPEYLILPNIRLFDEAGTKQRQTRGGNTKEGDLQRIHAENIETVLAEIRYRMEHTDEQSVEEVLPQLSGFIVPSERKH